MRYKAFLLRLIGAAILVPVIIPTAAVPATAAAAPTNPLWHEACAAGGHPCWVEQFALAMPNKVVVAHVRFDHQQGDRTGIIVWAPLGVALAPGVQLTLDGGKPITLPYERCSADGCDASAVLDQAAVEKFKRGRTLMVRYTIEGNRIANIPIRLDGLTKALDTLPR